MSGIGEFTEFGLCWEATGLKTAGKMCREIANDLNVYFAIVSHWCKKWRIGEYLESKPRSGVGHQHWIELWSLFKQILLQKIYNLPEIYPGDAQTIDIKGLTCQDNKVFVQKCCCLCLQKYEHSKTDRRTCRKPTEILSGQVPTDQARLE